MSILQVVGRCIDLERNPSHEYNSNITTSMKVVRNYYINLPLLIKPEVRIPASAFRKLRGLHHATQCSLYVHMHVQTLGTARSLGWKGAHIGWKGT
jgi:hypothetical protein